MRSPNVVVATGPDRAQPAWWPASAAGLLLALVIAASITIASVAAVGAGQPVDRGSPYAPPPAVFIQTD